jgi:hypothetical protein
MSGNFWSDSVYLHVACISKFSFPHHSHHQSIHGNFPGIVCSDGLSMGSCLHEVRVLRVGCKLIWTCEGHIHTESEFWRICLSLVCAGCFHWGARLDLWPQNGSYLWSGAELVHIWWSWLTSSLSDCPLYLPPKNSDPTYRNVPWCFFSLQEYTQQNPLSKF